jgi:signal transduction histidine kinase
MTRLLWKCCLLIGIPLASGLACSQPAFGQADTQYVKDLYDRALDFSESKLDSFPPYIKRIDSMSSRLNFAKGAVLSERLRGIEAELKGDYEQAITHYLNCLSVSRKSQWDNYEDCALSDLGIVYTNIKNPARAKIYYRQAVDLAISKGRPYSIINNLTNLGAICNMMHEPDSALHYLNMAWEYVGKYPQVNDLTSLRNNMGNAWFAQKEYDKALGYFRENYANNLRLGDSTQLWYDVLNIGDVMIEQGRYDSARYWINRAMRLAVHLGSRRKVADVEQLNAKFYERTGDFRKAFAALREWYVIDTSLVNEETRLTLLEMEERFKSREREQENRLLQSQVEAATLRSRNLLVGLWSSAILIIGGLFFVYQIRRKNRKLEEKNQLIEAQNDKLADLNAEKNSLISMVSHDLHTPFTTIQMWAQILESGNTAWPEEDQKAIDRIRTAANNGARMISRVLDVESSEVNRHRLQLEQVAVPDLLADLAASYRMDAGTKGIGIECLPGPGKITILTDRQLLERAVANLLSNAIKFSPPGTTVRLRATATDSQVMIQVEDQGPGISPEDQARLFQKYARAEARPTGGEKTTGLGLYIVRRIMDELHGQVSCDSRPGAGTRFTLTLEN